MSFLPKLIRLRPTNGSGAIRVAPLLIETAKMPVSDVLTKLGSSLQGVSQEDAEQRLEQHGPNVVAKEKHRTAIGLLARAMVNPLVVLLLILATISLLTGDLKAAIVMSAMVVLGVVLRFVQEYKADAAAERLKAMISITATVIRGGQAEEVPLEQLVPGDMIKLSAGDMIPADVRVVAAKDLFVIQASLTGESLPVEKTEAVPLGDNPSPLELTNVAFLGTSVESGVAFERARDWPVLFRVDSLRWTASSGFEVRRSSLGTRAWFARRMLLEIGPFTAG